MEWHPKEYAECIFGLDSYRIGTSNSPRERNRALGDFQRSAQVRGIGLGLLRPRRQVSGLVVRRESPEAEGMAGRTARFTLPSRRASRLYAKLEQNIPNWNPLVGSASRREGVTFKPLPWERGHLRW